MKQLLIWLFIISPFLGSAQDSIQKKEKPDIFIGVDLFNPALSIFSKKKGAEAIISVPLNNKWQIVAEAGYEQNTFDNTVWNVDVNGAYARIGTNWFISQDIKNPNVGYYFGGRLAYSPYKQTVNRYLIQGNGLPSLQGSLPENNASAFWLEPVVGGHVQIMESNFYIDTSVKLKIILSNSNDYNLDAIVIPGFGADNSGLNIGVNWSIGYAF